MRVAEQSPNILLDKVGEWFYHVRLGDIGIYVGLGEGFLDNSTIKLF